MPIEIKNVSYTYMKHTPYEKKALQDINLTINEGDFVAIAGHTGSGKSTLMQHINGLIRAQEGKVFVDGVDISQKKSKRALEARRKVGLVFQYPEQQLFEETIAEDIAFGPKNFGLNETQVEERVKQAMQFVELDYKQYKDKSPFLMSGGQMRRIAIAGIIALKPKYLVLDEPTAGLDPRLKQILLKKIQELHKKEQTTIIMVSHNMDDIAFLADKVAILNQGKLMAFDSPEKVFSQDEILNNAGLLKPEVMQLLEAIKRQGIEINTVALNKAQVLQNIYNALRKRGFKC